MNNLKKVMVSLTLAGSFILGIGVFSTADAQDWRWRRDRRIDQQRRGGQVESTGNIDRNRNGIDDRYEVNGQVDINQNGIPDNQENYGRYGRNRGYYGNDGYYRNRGYGNYGYGVNNAEFQNGYSDGLDRGRKDAQTNRAMDPNNSSHYRSGNAAYRAGFERGFYQAYRQYSYGGR